ncbi:hypothetical protein [Paracoccus sulfuroxidans]|uniref:hypothetical protein n=1 Tax=Paracoccus sulfuroxidans TaxID=384678 RepID=UPI00119DF38E|nr:hypothetical protein [Paracoccus sulfuroxidans]
MATWTNISNEDIKHKKPITVAAGRALRDNPVAIAEGAAGAPRVQDAALALNITSAGVDWVAKRIIAAAWNALGQTVMAVHHASTTSTLVPGTTVLGSELSATNAAGRSGPSLPGTWRLQGNVMPVEGAVALVPDRASVWLRIV